MEFLSILINVAAGDAMSHYVKDYSIPAGKDTSARCQADRDDDMVKII